MKFNKRFRFVTFWCIAKCFAWATCCTGSVQGGFIPPQLNPGDRYHLVFVTSGTRDATSGDISDYDAFVQAQANTSVLTGGIRWRAIASTSSVDAIDHALVTASIFNMRGDRLATSRDDMWDGTLEGNSTNNERGIGYDENALSVSDSPAGNFVWTGSDAFGHALRPLGEPSSGGGRTTSFGLAGSAGSSWMHNNDEHRFFSCRLYAISQELVVPNVAVVPEPASLFLWCWLAVAFTWTKKRKERDATGHNSFVLGPANLT